MAQAGSVYDPDADERPKHAPSDDDLRDITGISPDEESEMDSAALRDAEEGGSSFYNPRGDSGNGNKKGADKGALSSAEQKAGSLYNPGGDGGLRALTSKRQLLKKALKSKWLIGGAIGGGGMLIFVIILLILLSSLKIPNLMQHIVGYQFARVTRQYSNRVAAASDEALAVQTAKDTVWGKIKQKYTSGKARVRGATWDKINKYRPDQVTRNLATEQDMRFTYEKTAFKRARLVGVTMGGTFYEIKPVTGVQRFIPGVKSLINTQNQAEFVRAYRPALDGALRSTSTNGWVRFLVARQMRQRLGISLIAWHLDKFSANDKKQARLEETRQLDEKTRAAARNPDNAKTPIIQKAEQDAAAAEEAVVGDPAKLQAAIDEGGVPDEVKATIDNAVKSTLSQKVLGSINFLYAILLPVCIIYDGSVQRSQPTIDNQTAQQRSIFYYMASAADEQKNGSPNTRDDAKLNSAVEAANAAVGDISKSNAEIRASGGTVNTTSTVSAEAGAGGFMTYSIFDALPLGNTFAGVLNYLADNGCPLILNTDVAIGVGLLNIGASVISLGGPEAVGNIIAQGAKRFITRFSELSLKRIFAKKLGEKAVTEVLDKETVSRGWKWALTKKAGGVLATIGAAEIARLIVASRAGLVNSGLAQGVDRVNAADSGGNLEASALSQATGGRTLLKEELVKSDAADITYIQHVNASKSFTERYFAVTNADSLVTHFGMSIQSAIGNGIFNSFIKYVGSVLQPFKMASLFHLTGVAKAATDPTVTNYGNVQFGWSEDEEKLIASNASYKPLENSEALDQSGQMDEIGQKYAKCFGYAYDANGNGDLSPTDPDGNLTADPNASIGHLLADASSITGKPSIVRDADGNVLDEGDCSPTNLGPNNPTYGDMVFRFRLAMSYSAALDQLNDLQNVTN